MSRSLSFAFLALFVAVAGLSAGADEPVAGAVDVQNAKCPVSGMAVKPGVTTTVNGMTVHFCSPEHARAYRENPAAYERALRADPAVARRMEMVRTGAENGSSAVTPKAAELHDAMRKLWEDHVWWTREFVISALADLPDKDVVTKRLLKNQDDIGNAIKPYYGGDAGTKLTALLKDHIQIAATLVGALKENDSATAESEKAKWVKNADDIAAFLAKANPAAWPLDAGKKMMREHLDLTTQEVKARLDKDWDADVAAFEKVHDQALRMADMLCEGIQRQFPAQFQ